ncbi:MAG: DeoR/GlpR family DNA-binding transcription regulator [Treponema sp.]|jgi:DeoR/GlpR family transcriptional regulator of sugar metabolism|nr:DeoR/GlpR family DNA-binding transcription regulator [Treponema sp.]
MPSNKGLKIDIRRKRILDILNKNGQVRVADLARDLGTTPVTIRSDLAALKQDGYLERTAGGAIQTVKNFYNMEFLRRSQKNSWTKKHIAQAAASMIHDGETLFINSGTTSYFTAVALKQYKNLNVVTNSLMVAVELGNVPTFRVILLGGQINTQYSFTYGSNCLDQLRQYNAAKTILSMDGISVAIGFTTYHAEEAEINRAMISRARETIVVADHTKIDYESFSLVSPLSSAACLVTNRTEALAPSLERIAATGLRVMGVETPDRED